MNYNIEIKSKMKEEEGKDDFDDVLFPFCEEVQKTYKNYKEPQMQATPQEQPRSNCSNRLGIDEAVLNEAEKESELLESMIEMNEDELNMYQEPQEDEIKEELMDNFLEEIPNQSNYDLF